MVKITLVNPNLIQRTAVAPYALDILATSLKQAGYEPEVLDLTPSGYNWKQTVDEYFTENNPHAVLISYRNNSDVYFQSLDALPEGGSFVPSHKRITDVIRQYVPTDRIIGGGVGFSFFYKSMMEQLDLKYGVIGAGEMIVPDLIKQMDLDQINLPFVVQKGQLDYKKGRTGKLSVPLDRSFVDNKWYYENGETVGFRMSNGCDKIIQPCIYCPETHAKGNIFYNSIENILQELDQLIELGIKDVHFADSEINRPFQFSKEVAKAIIERQYPKDLRFWGYAQITPFDEEYAKLWKEAGIHGIMFGTDHTEEKMLKGFNKEFTFEDIRRTTEICNDYDIAVGHELLFGLFGETEDSIKIAIEKSWSLNPHIIATTIGIGIYPTTLLANDSRIHEIINQEPTSWREKGLYALDKPLYDISYFIDPKIEIPDIYHKLEKFVGTNQNRILIPKDAATTEHDNSLVRSKRIDFMQENALKGSAWFYHPLQFLKKEHLQKVLKKHNQNRRRNLNEIIAEESV